MGTNTYLSDHRLSLNPGEILCLAQEENYDLYYVLSGKLMVCVNQNTQVTPIAYLGKGEYLGELSFFDHRPRSASVIALEPTEVVNIPSEELIAQIPRWIITMSEYVINKIRLSDTIIREKGIRRKNVESVKPLSIQDQRRYFKIIDDAIQAKLHKS